MSAPLARAALFFRVLLLWKLLPNNVSRPAPRALFAVTVFLGAFLLFFLEPLVAKRILPWFGGSSAVWLSCLVFYQAALLLGYLYAQRAARGTRVWMLHAGLLACSLLLMPIGPSSMWQTQAAAHPWVQLFLMLTATVALPFLLLSATGPLLQSWYAGSYAGEPYKLYALSNVASLAALLAYPFLVEPVLPMRTQRWVWSAAYLAYAALSAWIASRTRVAGIAGATGMTTGAMRSRWFALAAAGSMLLLSVTNHITSNIAPVPLLWILPLAIYLATFVLAFAQRSLYRRSVGTRALVFTMAVLAYALYDINTVLGVQVGLPLYLIGLFICCGYCHAELNELRPAASELTSFYLMIAAGGAAGALIIGVLAPVFFSGVYELPFSLLALAVIVLAVTWEEERMPVRLLWAGMAVLFAVVFAQNVQAYHKDALSIRRSFYGSLRVVQSSTAGQQTHALFHGTIEHGAQFLTEPMRSRPTTYYGPDSGIGIVLRECFPAPKHVAVVGLGVGTLAAYGQAGDEFRFYEINPQVRDIANSLFTYLRESKARTSVVIGDARLSLEAEHNQRFDVIALDAFSGDAVPVHLLTSEALTLYLHRLQPDGVLAFHVSNDYLDLASVVHALAEMHGLQSMLVRSHSDDDQMVLPADWVIVTANPAVLQNPSLAVHSIAFQPRPGLVPWTDDRNDLWHILKTARVY